MEVLIIEDELAASKRLSNLIIELEPDLKILETLDSVETSIHWFQNHPTPDLVFMDIQLGDGLSFEIFETCEINTPIIFTTAYDQYTLQAFKVNSVDYLLKPIKEDELKQSLMKYRKLQGATSSKIDYKSLALALKESKPDFQKRIVVKYGQNIKAVAIADIAYFYTEEKIVFLQTSDGKRYAIDYNLDQLEQLLDPAQFFRINRQFIVGVTAIDSMYTYSKSRVKINLIPPVTGETIVSTERSSKFKKWLSGEVE